DPTLCAILMEMFPEAIVKHNPRPQLKPEELVPRWCIGRNTYSDLYYVAFKLGALNQNYDGAPSQLVAYFAQSGVVVPEHILAEYRQVWKPNPDVNHPKLQNDWWAEYEAIHGK